MHTVIDIVELKEKVATYRAASEKVAFVPTMGALHPGHLALVQKAKELADRVIVSVFVNPTQFGPGEDFERYPRTLIEDSKALSSSAVDIVFAPTQAEMYPKGFQTTVLNQGVSKELCGASRPGHFDGVCTVVLKLLNIASPDVAVFGKKDYQQFRIIQTLVRDLHLPIEIVGVETVREEDGLAMSSRNRFLSEEERQAACILPHALNVVYDAFEQGEKNPISLEAAFANTLEPYPQVRIDYGEIRRQVDVSKYALVIDSPPVFLAAVRIGDVRLIDNLELT